MYIVIKKTAKSVKLQPKRSQYLCTYYTGKITNNNNNNNSKKKTTTGKIVTTI